MILFFVLFISTLIVGLHYIVAFYISDIFNLSSSISRGVTLFFILMPIIFVASNAVINYYSNSIASFVYKYSAIWMGMFFYLLLATVIIIFYKAFELNIINALGLPMSRDIKLYVPLFLYSIAIILNIYGIINAHYTRIVKQDIYISNLPESWEGKTAALIADTHYGPIHNDSTASKTVAMINDINPDYLFMSGDFYDGPRMDYVSVTSPYKNIKAKKYFVSGNHEVYASSRSGGVDVIKLIKDAGFIITNGTSTLDNGVNIVGVDYKRENGGDEVTSAFDKVIDKNLPSIVLKHVPSSIEKLNEKGADLVLSGHTHNGQMFPFNYITYLVYKGYNYGLKTYISASSTKDTQVYTTSGVGSWGPPQRIGTNSEIVLLTFHKK